jgi:hypothetical protein
MKKIFLAALAVLCFAGTAWAQVPVRIKYQPVLFRTNAAANDHGGAVDSVAARRVGAAGASSVLDTTVAISTDGWMIYNHNSGVAGDTTSAFCTLIVYGSQDGGDDGCESGADSLAVAMQVSADGKSWLTAAVLPAQTASAGTNPIGSRNNQTIVNGAFMDRLSLNGAAVANGQPVWMFRYKQRVVQSLSEVSEGNLHFWPLIRFVLSFHDAKGYKVQAKVGSYSAVN